LCGIAVDASSDNVVETAINNLQEFLYGGLAFGRIAYLDALNNALDPSLNKRTERIFELDRVVNEPSSTTLNGKVVCVVHATEMLPFSLLITFR
jgi:hypothetical protein